MRNGRHAATELLLIAPWSMVAPTHSAQAALGFVDTVQRFGTISPSVLRLVAFDWEGTRRFELECERIKADDVHAWLLRLTRELYPAPPSHLRLS